MHNVAAGAYTAKRYSLWQSRQAVLNAQLTGTTGASNTQLDTESAAADAIAALGQSLLLSLPNQYPDVVSAVSLFIDLQPCFVASAQVRLYHCSRVRSALADWKAAWPVCPNVRQYNVRKSRYLLSQHLVIMQACCMASAHVCLCHCSCMTLTGWKMA